MAWFQDWGLAALETRLKANKGKNNIIIFNLGVNDAGSETERNKYGAAFKTVAQRLKNIDSGCKLYYADVYPVSVETLLEHDGGYNVTMNNIQSMNTVINTICQNGYFSKLNLNAYLKQNGWFYAKNKCTQGPNKNKSLYDGIHPSPTTAASVYNFCIEKTGCKSGTVNISISAN